VISVDTNVLVRVLVNDPEETVQTKTARQVVRNAQEVFVSQIVQVETVWVLNRGYRLEKSDLISLLNHLFENISYHLEKEEIFKHALEMYTTGSADFSDYLILADAQHRSLKVVTFDKRLAKAKGAVLAQD
jgi:predicted nucleic-acid-binding protein